MLTAARRRSTKPPLLRRSQPPLLIAGRADQPARRRLAGDGHAMNDTGDSAATSRGSLGLRPRRRRPSAQEAPACARARHGLRACSPVHPAGRQRARRSIADRHASGGRLPRRRLSRDRASDRRRRATPSQRSPINASLSAVRHEDHDDRDGLRRARHEPASPKSATMSSCPRCRMRSRSRSCPAGGVPIH